MTNDIKIAKVVKSHRDCKDCIIIKSNLLNDDSSGPHFVVKFVVVMSLEESLTIVVTHFKKIFRISKSGQTKFFFLRVGEGEDLP